LRIGIDTGGAFTGIMAADAARLHGLALLRIAAECLTGAP